MRSRRGRSARLKKWQTQAIACSTRGLIVAPQFGMKLAQELDIVIYEKLGPGAIRPRLENIVATGQCSAAEAKGLLEEIDAFNRHLIQVHDELRPKPKPARAPEERRPPSGNVA